MLRCCSFALLAVGAAGLLFSTPAQAAAGPHPHLHRALYELREARRELKGASHNFGGHRKAAIADINAAIGQLEKALKFTGDPRPFKGNPKAEHYRKYKHYPHIHHAIVELKETVGELKSASHNYGGHRKAALKDTQAALKQLRVCIEFANTKK